MRVRKGFIPLREFARRVEITPRTARNWCKTGYVDAYQAGPGGWWYVREPVPLTDEEEAAVDAAFEGPRSFTDLTGGSPGPVVYKPPTKA